MIRTKYFYVYDGREASASVADRIIDYVRYYGPLFAINTLLWPFRAILLTLRLTIRGKRVHKRYQALLTLIPLGYLGLLLAVNYLVL